MRFLYASLALLLSLFILSQVNTVKLTKITDEMVALIEKCEVSITEHNFDTAASQIEHIAKLWQDYKSYITLVVRHTEIDNIAFSLAKIRQSIAEKKDNGLLGETSVLKEMFSHLSEMEKITLGNLI